MIEHEGTCHTARKRLFERQQKDSKNHNTLPDTPPPIFFGFAASSSRFACVIFAAAMTASACENLQPSPLEQSPRTKSLHGRVSVILLFFSATGS
jgi:hypothetical protein